MASLSIAESKLKRRKGKDEINLDNSEAIDENNMSLSELKVKLTEEQISSPTDWKNTFDEDDNVTKSLSPSALSSDASSVHSGKFDTDFSVGQRIEVKDYRTDTWYAAKVVEVDYDDREIFIHYERWSVRFDEWLKWDSQRIRKIRLPLSHHRFKVGEHVLATWNYTKKYPAAVKSVLPDDKYEVLFYDGFAKILKGNRITKIDPRQINLLEKMPKEIPRAPPIGSDLDVRNIGTKEERRQKKRRLNVVELLQPTKRRRADESPVPSPSVSSDQSSEVPIRRRRGRQRAVHNRSTSVTSTTLKRKANTRDVSNRVNSVTKNSSGNMNVNSIKKEIRKDNGHENDEKETKVSEEFTCTKSVASKFVIENIKTEITNDFEKTKNSDNVTSPKLSEGNPSNVEKDSSNSSEQEFTGFEAVRIKLEPHDIDDVENKNGTDISDNSSVPIVVNNSTKQVDQSVSLTSLQTARRISKRGRIPKLKTSLGNISSTPRLSSFPKIKPRGHIFKSNEHTVKGRNRVGKSRNKLMTKSVDNDENNVMTLSSLMRGSAVSRHDSDKITDKDKSILDTDYDDKLNLINMRNLNNDLLMINSGISGSPGVLTSPVVGSTGEVTRIGGIDEGNISDHQGLLQDGGDSEHRRKKGRRLKKSLKRFDEKKNKNWKIANRRKADEEDDPERWSGDIPDGAKPVFIDGGDGKMRQSIIIPDKKLPSGWTKHTIIRKNSSKWDVLLVNPNGRKFRSRKDLRTYYNEMNKDYPEDCFDFVVGRTKMTSNLIEMETMAKKQGLSPPSLKQIPNRKKESKKSGSDDGFSSVSPSNVTAHDGEKRVKTLMPKTKPPVNYDNDESIVSAAAAAAAVTAVTTNTNMNNGSITTPVSSLQQHVNLSKTPATPLSSKLPADMTPISGISMTTPDSDGAASWICPKESCGKHFRKDNLLQMHIKHYHPEYNQFLDSAPNVADLAYARIVGEPLDETVGAASFLDRINKYEARRKAKGDIVGVGNNTGIPKKNIGAYSPLRKALMKLTPGKDCSDFSDGLADYLSKVDSSPSALQGKFAGGLEHDVTDGDMERFSFDNERARSHSYTDDQSGDFGNTGSHSTLKELLSGTGSFDESAPDSPITPPGGARHGTTSALYRFSRNKPLVSLEKLNVTTDSNDSVPDTNDHESIDVSNCTEAEQDDLLKKEEIINCLCGYAEEDGLMIQCDLCLCWQHGYCNDIKQESDVPEKYICSICRNPKRLRNSSKYSFNFDWLKEGKLPTLSFRNQNKNEIQQRETLLRRSHDLVATLLNLQKVVKSLRLKTHIAGRSDHPKLYLWAKSWEKETKGDVKVNKDNNKECEIKIEDIKKEPTDTLDVKKENQPPVEDNVPKGPQAPVPEAPIDLVECRLKLLEHIEDYQSQVESRLTTLEAQVVALESQDPDLANNETIDYYPRTKHTIQMLTRDLTTVRKVISLN